MGTELQHAYLSAGSNLGNRKENLGGAVRTLGDVRLAVTRVSSLYETEPVGYTDQPWFLNIALEVETHLDPRALLERCQEVERAFGRLRTFPGAPRTIDLDILIYGDRVIAEADLALPHPRMMDRRFVLAPLAEIRPEAIHPVTGRTVRELEALCRDPAVVRRYPPGAMP